MDIENLDRNNLVYLAKLAEQAERFDEMVNCMKQVVKNAEDALTVEERNLLSVAYKNIVGSLRSSWRIIRAVGSKNEGMVDHTNEYIAKIETELDGVCQEAIALIDEFIFPKLDNESDAESLVFYHKMKGDYYRYLILLVLLFMINVSIDNVD
eukprot:TRINITY_DN1651_c0_g1_i2.p1 TRINITY_DN1651_c0_g1~~TRINITY_DN1651_c0_g1_i2.p1  ORF type:complete len:153 (-),score=22.31 TRINITY_DN1651_c0_g1_i2:561-1019(-)